MNHWLYLTTCSLFFLFYNSSSYSSYHTYSLLVHYSKPEAIVVDQTILYFYTPGFVHTGELIVKSERGDAIRSFINQSSLTFPQLAVFEAPVWPMIINFT